MTGNKPFFYGWRIVAVSMFGMCFGYPGAFIFSFSSFIIPLSEQFGWSRAEISFGNTISNTTMMLALPLLGMLIDKRGVKAILLPATVIFGVIIACFSFVAALWQFYLAVFLLTLLGGGASTISYVPLIATWFEKRKGLALGLGLSGAGIAGIIMPRLIYHVIDTAGWREAYMLIGAINILLVAPLIFIVVRSKPADIGLHADGAPPEDSPAAANLHRTGYTFRECLKLASFWKMAVATLLLGLALSGALSQIVPLLVDRGMSRAEAAGTASLLGFSIIIARIISGLLMDRFHAPYVASLALLSTCLGFASLALMPSNATAVATTIAIGVGLGVEFDVIGYFCAQYFGRYAIGRMYGVMYLIFNIGGAIGIYLAGYSYDLYSSYSVGLVVASLSVLAGIALFLWLGRYPVLPVRAEPAAQK